MSMSTACLSMADSEFLRAVGRLIQKCHYKDVDTKRSVFVLSSADALIKAAVLPLTYAGMRYLRQGKFTMYRPIKIKIAGYGGANRLFGQPPWKSKKKKRKEKKRKGPEGSVSSKNRQI